MKLGSLTFENKVALAPMAGVTDLAFRELCRSYGAAFVVGEMVSAKGLNMHNEKSATLLNLSEKERPSAIQLFGDHPEVFARATEIALERRPDFLDINMGCPAPKIVNNGAGCALMKDLPLAESIIKAVVKESTVPVTVKFRAGWDENCINAADFAKMCESAGASAITIHARTKMQAYAPPVSAEIIRCVKKAVHIPVIGNGDVVDGETAQEMIAKTDCDMLMVGRGALGRPWMFYAVNAYLKDGTILPEPPIAERMRVMCKHIEKLCEYKGELIGMKEARKHAGWYMKGIRGAAAHRREASTLAVLEDIYILAFRVIEASESE